MNRQRKPAAEKAQQMKSKVKDLKNLVLCILTNSSLSYQVCGTPVSGGIYKTFIILGRLHTLGTK